MDVARRARLIVAISKWPADLPRGTISRFAASEGVSRKWVHDVRRRLAVEPVAALLTPSSRAPRSSPHAIDADVAAAACQARLDLQAEGWDAGPASVQSRLRDRGVTPPSRATLSRLFAREGLVTPSPRKRPRSSYRRFVHALPNDCWQLDAFETRLADGTKATVFQVTDDHARLAVASLAARSETSNAAIAVVTTGIERHGPPRRLLTDNGSAFNTTRRGYDTALTRMVTRLGIEAITGRPGHPTTQGKNERHHKTTRQWLAARPAPATLDELQTLIDEFDRLFNTTRPHQGIAGATPAQAYTALPKAIPPTPTIEPTPTPTRHDRVVDTRGTIYAAERQFHLGAAYLGQTITVIHDGTDFHFIDHNGTVIATLNNPPTGRYTPVRPTKQSPKT